MDSTSATKQQHFWFAYHHVYRSSMATLFLIILGFAAYVSTRLLLSSLITKNTLPNELTLDNKQGEPEKFSREKMDEVVIPLNCSLANTTKTWPADYYPTNYHVKDHTFSGKCPEYFRWIYEDLSPWKNTGITEKMVMSANSTANFRLIILNGKVYVKTYSKAYQSRDTFNLWGILQLLRRYPGQVPDLDLMFDCNDMPVIQKDGHVKAPPPLFKYCADDKTFDIVFPDWSFWGWPEINIKPWEQLSRDLKDGNERTKWTKRDTHAYWKGNPDVAPKRRELLKCNVSDQDDRNALIYAQNWYKETEQGFKQSDLSKQCNHRFKIYIEGRSWSVSEKYILACDSVTLLVKPNYYDFFTRSLMPLQHYWPIRDDDMCRSIESAVDWGNSHKRKAQEIGSAGSRFIQDELQMDYIYDYMFHLLSHYARLLTYKPTVPPGAVELCTESMACPEQNILYKKYMIESLAKGPSNAAPCDMPPPYDRKTLGAIVKRKKSSMKKVEKLEKQFWDSQNI